MAQSKSALGFFFWPKQTERRNIMAGKRSRHHKVHKVATKMGRKRKTTIHGGFKAMEHKASGHKKGGHKRGGRRRKRA